METMWMQISRACDRAKMSTWSHSIAMVSTSWMKRYYLTVFPWHIHFYLYSERWSINFFTRWQQHFDTHLATVDLQIGRLHKVAEEVGVILQVCWSEQPEILHHAVWGHLLIEEPEKLVFLLISLALLHNINHLQDSRNNQVFLPHLFKWAVTSSIHPYPENSCGKKLFFSVLSVATSGTSYLSYSLTHSEIFR